MHKQLGSIWTIGFHISNPKFNLSISSNTGVPIIIYQNWKPKRKKKMKQWCSNTKKRGERLGTVVHDAPFFIFIWPIWSILEVYICPWVSSFQDNKEDLKHSHAFSWDWWKFGCLLILLISIKTWWDWSKFCSSQLVFQILKTNPFMKDHKHSHKIITIKKQIMIFLL